MDVILIAAISQDGYIAHHSQEKITWSKDLYLFKKQTMGWPVIMGSNTFGCIQKELKGRDIVVAHRNDDPGEVLAKLNSKKCFIAGGGKTNSRFSPYLTHLYITPHPLIFGDGVQLFFEKPCKMDLILESTVPIKGEKFLYQFQYRVNSDLRHNT